MAGVTQELLNLEKYKTDVHKSLLSKLDLEKLSRVDSTQARQVVANLISDIIKGQGVPLSFDEQARIQADLLDEVFGLGPLEPLLRDPKISDILVNSKDRVFVERHGKLQLTDTVFRDDRHLLQIIDRIVSRVGRRVDESSPMVDARLPRWLARKRHHPPTGARWSLHVDPALRHRPCSGQSTG
jgi:pilus assembly protein CpaF